MRKYIRIRQEVSSTTGQAPFDGPLQRVAFGLYADRCHAFRPLVMERDCKAPGTGNRQAPVESSSVPHPEKKSRPGQEKLCPMRIRQRFRPPVNARHGGRWGTYDIGSGKCVS